MDEMTLRSLVDGAVLSVDERETSPATFFVTVLEQSAASLSPEVASRPSVVEEVAFAYGGSGGSWETVSGRPVFVCEHGTNALRERVGWVPDHVGSGADFGLGNLAGIDRLVYVDRSEAERLLAADSLQVTYDVFDFELMCNATSAQELKLEVSRRGFDVSDLQTVGRAMKK